jgi:hypothetical protein
MAELCILAPPYHPRSCGFPDGLRFVSRSARSLVDIDAFGQRRRVPDLPALIPAKKAAGRPEALLIETL